MQPDRRSILGGILTATAASTVKASSIARQSPAQVDRELRRKIDHVVVIYAENRSFNNLFADFPGLQHPLSAVAPNTFLQKDRDGSILGALPRIWQGLVPTRQTVQHRSFQIGEADLPQLPNSPFELRTPEGDPLPHGLVTRDLVHSFYNNQLQINGGRNDGFVAWGDSGALVMGRYGDAAVNLRLHRIAREFTLCDNFFMGAFGGSFLNHQYLIAARPPFYPAADASSSRRRIVELDPTDTRGVRPMLRPGTPKSAMEGPVRFVPDSITPDFWVVNTMLPPFAPTYIPDPDRPDYADAANEMTLVPQNHATIGDALTARGVDWAWYAAGWWEALAGRGAGGDFPSRPNFQTHHQPFNYFARFAPGSPDRNRHLRDGGTGETARTNRFMADVEAGRLPAVSFYKPQGDLNMHAGTSDVDAGDRHIAGLIEALCNGPQWNKMLVVVAFDENGGWWDHVPPPQGDRWGPGTRVPAIIISPHARRGHVDHTIYDTGSIARFMTRRWGLDKLPGLAAREDAMMRAGGAAPGDLTAALEL